MEYKKENKPVLKYTNKENTQTFSEGDAVICFTEHKVYRGTIVAFSRYEENERADPQYSVYLDTSKNIVDRSCEIIKAEDITYMCKISVDELVGHPQLDESLDKYNFIDIIVRLGHEKEKAEIMYECMKDIMALYNIPLSSALICAIQEADLSSGERSVDELMDISSRLLEVMGKVFQSVTGVVMQKAKDGIESV